MYKKVYDRNQAFLQGKLKTAGDIYGSITIGETGKPDIYSYNELINKPSINGVELVGNKVSIELELQDAMDSLSNIELDSIFNF